MIVDDILEEEANSCECFSAAIYIAQSDCVISHR
jgi:hypothetical protein